MAAASGTALLVALGVLLAAGADAFSVTPASGLRQREAIRMCAQGQQASRRDALLAGAAVFSFGLPLREADAFDNRVAPKGKFPPTPGAPKKGVGKGVGKDGKLMFCTGEPNCFSPSSSAEDDPDHYYPPWKYTGKSKEEAMAELVKAIGAYPPGQNKIDGGGFKVEKQTADYVWVVFESAKRGYRDDMEFALASDGEVQVRSSSRLGYLDFGVNMKRINWFVEYLSKEKGWECTKITKELYPRYFEENTGQV